MQLFLFCSDDFDDCLDVFPELLSFSFSPLVLDDDDEDEWDDPSELSLLLVAVAVVTEEEVEEEDTAGAPSASRSTLTLTPPPLWLAAVDEGLDDDNDTPTDRAEPLLPLLLIILPSRPFLFAILLIITNY